MNWPINFIFILEVEEKETPGGAGGLDDDEVWGDVDDVSNQLTIQISQTR